MGYSMVQIGDIEPAGPGGVVRFLRREIGAQAFGVNWFELPPNAEGRGHDESQTGQEEVNIIIRGSGTYMVGDEQLEVREGTALRFDPGDVQDAEGRPRWADDDRDRCAAGLLPASRAVLRLRSPVGAADDRGSLRGRWSPSRVIRAGRSRRETTCRRS